MDCKTIFEKNCTDKDPGYFLGAEGINSASASVPEEFLRKELKLPSVGEREVVRHYTGLSRRNLSLDEHFYPLGSCTMKYNPKLNEELAGLEGFSNIHPYQSESMVQGALELMYELEAALCALTGMKRFSLQPASGAQGEFTAMLMIRAYHKAKKNKKTRILVPDSSHGTNPASAAMCGYDVVAVESRPDGLLDIDRLKAAIDETVAGMMLTNPNTLGLFERDIQTIADLIHAQDGLLYYDGANFNALMGITTPALMGFDVVHLNLHKTFSTPHGCGGPGAGVVGVNEKLADFLPIPLVAKKGDKFYFDYKGKRSIGKVRSFYGNFGVLVRAYAYILRLGAAGLKKVSQQAVLNANYLRAGLKDHFEVCSGLPSMHEVVFSCARQKDRGASALQIAKRLIDYGMHPPTMYFPLIVKEALMVEPTETESKAMLDGFVRAMLEIDRDITANPRLFADAPHNSPVKRVDETRAARQPDLRYRL